MTEAPRDERELQQSERWWQRYTGRRQLASDARRGEYAHVENAGCQEQSVTTIMTADLAVKRRDEGVSVRLPTRRMRAPIAGLWRRATRNDRRTNETTGGDQKDLVRMGQRALAGQLPSRSSRRQLSRHLIQHGIATRDRAIGERPTACACRLNKTADCRNGAKSGPIVLIFGRHGDI